MFGSYKVNGIQVDREISAAQALPGYLYVLKVPSGIQTKPGDLLLKTKDGAYVRVHENPTVLGWSKNSIDKEVVVAYVDIEIKYEKVK